MEWSAPEHELAGDWPTLGTVGRVEPGETVEVRRADAEDGTALAVAVAGRGEGTAPHVLVVEGDARFPTFEEIQEAVDMTTLQGAMLSVGVFVSNGAAAERVTDPGPRGVVLQQIAAINGSAAARRLHLTGGLAPGTVPSGPRLVRPGDSS